VTADDDGKLSWAVRIAVAVAVFSLGVGRRGGRGVGGATHLRSQRA
jgi:hypothetical protein